MRIDFATPFVAAHSLWRRDRSLLTPIAGLFLFVPQLAVLLLVPPAPQLASDETIGAAAEAAAQAWSQAFAAWASANGGWYILAQLLALMGALTIVALYVDRERPPAGGALIRAFGLLPRYALASIIVSLPAGALMMMGLTAPLIFYVAIVPIFYVFARTMLVAAVLVAERPIGAVAAIGRSWRLTVDHGWMLAGIYAAPALVGMIVGSVFSTLAGLGAGNPVAVAIPSVFAAAAAATVGVTHAILSVVVYARLASRGT